MSDNGKKPAPILDIDTLAEEHGATWKYQGVTYDYVRWSLLGLVERRRITNRHNRIIELEALDDPTEEDAEAYALAVRELIELATIGITSEIIDTMTPEQRSEVVTRFLALRLLRISDLTEKRTESVANWITSSTMATSSPALTPTGRKKKAHG